MQGPGLKDKVALITGGGGGIGAATARVFCDEGAAVVLVDANLQALARVVDALLSRDPAARVQTFEADVANADQAAAAAELAVSTFGRLDVLVNNAAMRNYSALADATPEEWQSMVSVNLVGTSNYCKAALPFLRKAGSGAIVNVSS
jgi:meso-butanediol dehydrogenase/(S,S)-butanediol dehydrogenase/diacetyl reductase